MRYFNESGFPKGDSDLFQKFGDENTFLGKRYKANAELLKKIQSIEFTLDIFSDKTEAIEFVLSWTIPIGSIKYIDRKDVDKSGALNLKEFCGRKEDVVDFINRNSFEFIKSAHLTTASTTKE